MKLEPGPPTSTQTPWARRSRLRVVALLTVVFFWFLLFLYAGPHAIRAARYHAPHWEQGSASDLDIASWINEDILPQNSSAVLPNIQPRIWQIYTPFKPEKIPTDLTTSWVLNGPSYSYSILDDEGSRAMIEKLSTKPDGKYKDALHIFDHTERWMLRGDLMRYVLLATKGGIYTDADMSAVKPLSAWVPQKWKKQVRLIVGLEADELPPVPGTTYPVQFATWTVAGAAGHPLFWSQIDAILHRLRTWPAGKEFTDDDVLKITGPAGWTEAVFKYLSEATGRTITDADVTGMREPRLFGDALVLPIDGFATGVPHSGASADNAKWTMVRHHFSGSWRNGGG